MPRGLHDWPCLKRLGAEYCGHLLIHQLECWRSALVFLVISHVRISSPHDRSGWMARLVQYTATSGTDFDGGIIPSYCVGVQSGRTPFSAVKESRSSRAAISVEAIGTIATRSITGLYKLSDSFLRPRPSPTSSCERYRPPSSRNSPPKSIRHMSYRRSGSTKKKRQDGKYL